MIKSICVDCRCSNDYHGKYLPRNIRWCCNYGKLTKNKKRCIDFEKREESPKRRIWENKLKAWKVSKFPSKKQTQ